MRRHNRVCNVNNRIARARMKFQGVRSVRTSSTGGTSYIAYGARGKAIRSRVMSEYARSLHHLSAHARIGVRAENNLAGVGESIANQARADCLSREIWRRRRPASSLIKRDNA